MFTALFQNIVWLGFFASLSTGLITNLGAVPTLFTKKVSKKTLDICLGIAAGVMLAATSFSLIIPSIETGGGGVRGATIALVGILIGGIFLDSIDRLFPSTNLLENSLNGKKNTESAAYMRKVWLFITAIAIHNFPEGLAVGVGFGDGNVSKGLGIAIAIGLQNIPEGLAVALPLLRIKYPKWKTYLIVLGTGLIEPIGGLIGVGVLHIAQWLLPFFLSFAAGAMLFVIAHEIIPETQNNGKYSKLSTHALLIGFVIMMFLDNVLG